VASIVSSNSNGASVSYTYDTLNRLSTVTDGRLQCNQMTTYAYDPASNLTTATLPNGVQSAMTYDALNRVTGLATQSTGYIYQRGPTGNLTGATELNGRTLTWNYDGIYRLTNETISSDPTNNNGTASYGLDPVGNRLSETTTLTGLDPGTFGYNADDEVSTETYDANGNTLTTGRKTFAYDSENHLTSMNSGAVTIVYDGDGNRVAKTVSGVTTQYLVDDLNPTGYSQVVEEVVNGAVTRQYTYGLQRIGENQVVNSTWTPSFYGYDGGGNVRQLTNSAGVITDTYSYDAFGNLTEKTGTTPNNYLYRGEQYDSDLGLYYLRARYYNTGTGRFLSMDPENGIITDPKSLHKYDYAGGNPVNAIDPTGRTAIALPRPCAGALGEYGCIALAMTTVAVLELPVVQKEIACSLNKDIDLLDGVASDITQPVQAVEFGKCSAEVGKCKRCYPVEAGQWAIQVHLPPCDPHYFKNPQKNMPPICLPAMGLPGNTPHFHLLLMTQTPFPECRCKWERFNGSIGGEYPDDIPDGMAFPDVGPATGGGPEWFE
jgi:RHS repeat-associated protein